MWVLQLQNGIQVGHGLPFGDTPHEKLRIQVQFLFVRGAQSPRYSVPHGGGTRGSRYFSHWLFVWSGELKTKFVGHLERAPAFHQCPSCPFEDNQKGKLSRHLVVCARKFKPDRNLEPPPDWEPPAKIPRMPKMRATGLNATVQAYQTLAANKNAQQQYQFLSKVSSFFATLKYRFLINL